MATFVDTFYKPIDMTAAAKAQYGSTATAVQTGQHLYNWAAQVNGQNQPLDLNQAVSTQWGTGYRLVHTGVHAYDWAAVRFTDLDLHVLPVLLIASDKFYDITGVQTGITRLRSVVGYVQDWYRHHTTEGFRLLKPLAISTDYTAAQWDNLSDITVNAANRDDLFHAAVAEYQKRLPKPGANLRAVLVPYTGESVAKWKGAAGLNPYAVAPQRASSVSCTTFSATGTVAAECADAVYAVGHELGHTWGLGHSCTAYPSATNCGQSLMEGTKPPSAILLSQEATALRASPFFT